MQCSEAGGCDGQVACLEANSGHVRAWLEEVIEDEVPLPGGLLLELQVTTFVGLLPNENLSGGFPQLPGLHHLKGCVCCRLRVLGEACGLHDCSLDLPCTTLYTPCSGPALTCDSCSPLGSTLCVTVAARRPSFSRPAKSTASDCCCRLTTVCAVDI